MVLEVDRRCLFPGQVRDFAVTHWPSLGPNDLVANLKLIILKQFKNREVFDGLNRNHTPSRIH